ncbi:alpha/beta hydrolase [Rudanella lutea]|uniref:alpha/beta hydrolase n=1 Tax=Rudanella lutea TaxID=451374 RepID=UPI00037BD4D7|nr:alpha/beta hydrolase-fold protein [Rudanella lutea]
MFRTIELSDSRFEHEGLRYVTVKTPNLRGRGDITFWSPEGANADTPLPLVILLHGVYGSHWAWSLKAGAHRTADRLMQAGQLPLFRLAMPSDGLWGDGSGYLPHNGYGFDRWIIDDVPAACPGAVSACFVAGLSMGGYGALRLMARYPDQFRAASGLSSITELAQMADFVEEPLDLYRQPDPADESVGALLLRNRDQLPPFRFDCGTDDTLLAANRTLHETLRQAGIPHEYAEYPGGHEWPYWETHLEDTLLFFGRYM